MNCPATIRNCRACGRRNEERAETCADCGADMGCKNDVVPGYSRCSNHGGPAPKRNFYGTGTMTTGSASRFPIVRLAAKYNNMQKNGQVMSNRAAVDVIDHRVRQLLERIDLDEAPDRIQKLASLWAQYTDALDEHRELDTIALRDAVDKEFEKVYHDYAAWSQVFQALDLRGKMVEREIKVLKEIKAIMTAEDGYELATKLLAAVMRVVGDNPKQMKQVQYEFTRIIGESGSEVIDGYGEDAEPGGDTDGGAEGLGDVDSPQFLHPGNQE